MDRHCDNAVSLADWLTKRFYLRPAYIWGRLVSIKNMDDVPQVFGPTLGRPTSILQARLLRLGLTVKF